MPNHPMLDVLQSLKDISSVSADTDILFSEKRTDLNEETSVDPLSGVEFVTDHLKNLSRNDRINKVVELKLKGCTVAQISKFLGVHRNTVNKYLKENIEESVKALNSQAPFNFVAEHLDFLNELEATLLQEFNALQINRITQPISKESTLHTPLPDVQLQIGGDSKLISHILKIREIKIQLMLNTGVIPKEPEKLYAVFKPVDQMGNKEIPSKSREEIINSILHLTTVGRTLPTHNTRKVIENRIIEKDTEDNEHNEY